MNPPLEDKSAEYRNLVIRINAEPVFGKIRTTAKLARALLINNQSMISGATVFFIGMQNLGLGVVEVWKAPLTQRETKIFKK